MAIPKKTLEDLEFDVVVENILSYCVTSHGKEKLKSLGITHDKLKLGQTVVKVDPKYFRPTEVDLLIGDPTKANTKLGWKPKYELKDLVKEMTISMPYAIKAGNLWHIKTDISAKLKPKQTLQPIIAALHPTPAVCGLPKQAAKDFITAFEGYDREYYSGFLGELNSDLASLKSKQSDLFVNLRCM